MGSNTLASASLSCKMYVMTASRFALASVLSSSTYAWVFNFWLSLPPASCENAGTTITSGRTNSVSKKTLFRDFISFHLSHFDTRRPTLSQGTVVSHPVRHLLLIGGWDP